MNKLGEFWLQSATLGFFGYSPVAPGTVGSLLGTIFSCIIFFLFRQSVVSFLILFLIIFAVIACGVAANILNEHDPACVILDEFVAMPVCFFSIHYTSMWMFVYGFLLFRIFDILKPFGLKKLEKLPGGLGIVADDIGAACYTNAVLRLINFIFGI
ncbi:MAG: phosphatidylglycerophosphatase A [Opitutales bacterium]|nr:phosphatidylglycerophosphatase A [Opitutales bacterium]